MLTSCGHRSFCKNIVQMGILWIYEDILLFGKASVTQDLYCDMVFVIILVMGKILIYRLILGFFD